MVIAIGIVGFVVVYIVLYIISVTFFGKKRGKLPFILPQLLNRSIPEDVVLDPKIRDACLKQEFQQKKIPPNINCIVIGSGIGGLTSAVLLARAGKGVLVLEQHDVAGGCCHTFVDKGYEFDVGIHYIGEMQNEQSVSRMLVDQITGGRLLWSDLDRDAMDVVAIGSPDSSDHMSRRFEWPTGKQRQIDALIQRFPKEEDNIKRFFELVDKCHNSSLRYYALKFLPLWLSRILVKTRLIDIGSTYFSLVRRSFKEVVDELIQDNDLRAILSYSFGDYGTLPSETPFTMQAALLKHFREGASYPIGGASEIAFNMIPIIEKNGGKVLVGAKVLRILTDDSGCRALGVVVQNTIAGEKNEVMVMAPLVISAIGVTGTAKLLNATALSKTCLPRVLSQTSVGVGAMSLFVGLKADGESLGLKKQNMWAFRHHDIDKISRAYLDLNAEEAAATEVPLLFISFPSMKDPLWQKRYPGRLTVTVVTFARYEWFAQWNETRVKRRGLDYNGIKKSIGGHMWRQTCQLFPQLSDIEVDYMDIGSPLSNNHYLGANRGEIYGLDHNLARFDPQVFAMLRPESGINGLVLSGQDITSCGFTGGMFGGLFAASHVLNRNLLKDLLKVRKMGRRMRSSKVD